MYLKMNNIMNLDGVITADCINDLGQNFKMTFDNQSLSIISCVPDVAQSYKTKALWQLIIPMIHTGTVPEEAEEEWS